MGSEGPWARSKRGELAGEGIGGDSVKLSGVGWSLDKRFGNEDGQRSEGWESFLWVREETSAIDRGVASPLPVAGRGERPTRPAMAQESQA